MRYWNEDILNHSGIKGQKHGVRRYQNKDGSYTQEGIVRYGRRKTNPTVGQKINRFVKKVKKAVSPSGKKESKPLTVRGRAKQMTDDELRSAINRRKLQNEYVDLHTKKSQKVKSTAGKIGSSIGKSLAKSAQAIPDAIAKGALKALEKGTQKLITSLFETDTNDISDNNNSPKATKNNATKQKGKNNVSKHQKEYNRVYASEIARGATPLTAKMNAQAAAAKIND